MTRDDISIAMTSIADASIPLNDRKFIRKVYANRKGKDYYQIIDRSVHYGWHPDLDEAEKDMKLEKAMKTFDVEPVASRPAWPAWTGNDGGSNAGLTDLTTGIRLLGSRQMLLNNKGFRSRYPNVCQALERKVLDLPSLMTEEIVVPIQETIDFDVKTEWSKVSVKGAICQRLSKALKGKFPDVGLTPKLSNKLGTYVYQKILEGVSDAEEEQSIIAALLRRDVKNYLDVRCTCSIGHSYNCVITNIEGSLILRRQKGAFFGALTSDSIQLTIDVIIKALFIDGKQLDQIDKDPTFRDQVQTDKDRLPHLLPPSPAQLPLLFHSKSHSKSPTNSNYPNYRPTTPAGDTSLPTIPENPLDENLDYFPENCSQSTRVSPNYMIGKNRPSEAVSNIVPPLFLRPNNYQNNNSSPIVSNYNSFANNTINKPINDLYSNIGSENIVVDYGGGGGGLDILPRQPSVVPLGYAKPQFKPILTEGLSRHGRRISNTSNPLIRRSPRVQVAPLYGSNLHLMDRPIPPSNIYALDKILNSSTNRQEDTESQPRRSNRMYSVDENGMIALPYF